MEETLVSRKDIARVAGVSERTVSRRESEWGLDKCKSAATERPRYFRERVNQILVPRQIIPRPI